MSDPNNWTDEELAAAWKAWNEAPDTATVEDIRRQFQGSQRNLEKPASDFKVDDLRARIAAAILRTKVGRCELHSYQADDLADAVIRALELEVSVTSKSNDGRFKSFAVEGYWEEVENDD